MEKIRDEIDGQIVQMEKIKNGMLENMFGSGDFCIGFSTFFFKFGSCL